MKLTKFINCNYDISISGITDDSRNVKKGYLFVATHGFHVDHFSYIEDAIQNGCVFIICDQEIDFDFPHLVVDNINDYYVELCQKFYKVQLENFHFIGVTGTDGKTTTSTIIKELIGDCAYIGTNGLDVCDKHYDTHNTTPCLEELYKDLSIVQKNQCQTVSMEVSSEALLHNRLKDFQFDIVCFTNITGDHLNVHKTFVNYAECKLKLLEHLKDDSYVIINGDDNILRKINCKNVCKFGFDSSNDCVIQNVEYHNYTTTFQIQYLGDVISFTTPYVGVYNVYNVVEAYLACRFFRIESSLLVQRIKELSPIKGRGEFIDFGQKYDIVLDYAHTINGIRSILENFRHYDFVITVTGCAGGREASKRSIIGKMVMEYSDISIFTMDDPRYEDVDEIIDQMVGDSKDYFRIIDREDAISFALSIAPENSVVLILGKGRDNYMAIRDKKIHYSDYDVIYHFFHKG